MLQRIASTSITQLMTFIATDRTPDILAPFSLARFDQFTQLGEKGAAAVGH